MFLGAVSYDLRLRGQSNHYRLSLNSQQIILSDEPAFRDAVLKYTMWQRMSWQKKEGTGTAGPSDARYRL